MEFDPDNKLKCWIYDANRVIPGQPGDEYLLPECADEDDYVSRALEVLETTGYDMLQEMGYERAWE